MSLSLPFIATSTIVIAATKSLMIMKWDAFLTGFTRPFSLLIFSVIFYFTGHGIKGLAYSYLFMGIILFAISIYVFGIYFSYGKLFKSLKNFRFFSPLVSFSIPQNLNMTFSTFITDMDVMMLGYFGLRPELIGFYGMGAQIVRNIRQIKLAFSSAYAPIIARLYKKGDIAGLSDSFSMVFRWVITLALPASLLVVLFRQDLLKLFHPSFTSDSTFMIILVVPALFYCSLSLANNIIVMTGHSMLNLFNSVSMAVLNTVLNYFLIPVYGLVGAAVATMFVSILISAMQIIQLYVVVGASLSVKKVYKPVVAAFPGFVFAVWAHYAGLTDAIAGRAFVGFAAVGVFVLLIFVLKSEGGNIRKRLPGVGGFLLILVYSSSIFYTIT